MSLLTPEQLKKYQRAGIQFLRDTPRAALLIDMGLGKTIISLTHISDMIFSFTWGRVLVVGPKRVVRKVWPDEIKNWSHTKQLKYSIIDGTPKQMREAVDAPTDIHLISMDRLHYFFSLRKFPKYDAIFFDESSKFRNPKSRRTLSAYECAIRVEDVILLTGTPAPNGLHQLWSQINLLDRGERLGTNFAAFKKRYFNEDRETKKVKAKNKKTQGHIEERIRDICFTLRAEDYQELPKLMRNKIEVELSNKVKAKYEQFEKEAVLDLGLDDEAQITVASMAALYDKLLQFANGAVYDRDKNYHVVHDDKIEALKDIVDEFSEEQVLVAYRYKSDLARLKKAFPSGRLIDTEEDIDAWNAEEVGVGFIYPGTGGIGLNLQKGGRHLVWFSQTWNLEDYLQLNKRLHREGQTKPVILHHLIAKGTVDEVIIKALKRKDKTQNALLDAMKRHLDDLLELM